MARHEHRWIDITTIGPEPYERRKCTTCGLEQRRLLIGFMEGPQLPNDDDLDWEHEIA